MITSGRSLSPSVWRRVFRGGVELRAGWRLFVFLAIVIVLLKASNLMVGLHGMEDTTLFLVRKAMDFFIFLLATWIMGRIEGRTIAEYGLPWRSIFGAQFWHGVLLGFASITSLLLAMRLAGVFYFGTITQHGINMWRWSSLYALVFILVTLKEEFASRGYWLFTLSSGIGFWPAAIVSSVVFGYGHHGNSGEDWVGLFNAGVFGLFACFLLRRTGNLWMPIGLHMAFDWGETYFYGVANSGKVLPRHLLISSSSGPAWLSGGTVGPEGSLLCTLVIIIVWLICAAWLREANYPKFFPTPDSRATP